MDTGVTQITAGSGFTCAVKKSQLYCWGYHVDGRLGIGPYEQPRTAPVLVKAFEGKTVQKVDAAGAYACAIVDTSVYCWGRNDYGNIGNGTNAIQFSPVKLVGVDGAVDINVMGTYDGGAARMTSLAIIGKSLFSWGSGEYGQRADGTNTSTLAPSISPSYNFQ